MDFTITPTWGFDIDGRGRTFNYRAATLNPLYGRRAVYFHYEGHLSSLTYSCTDDQWEEIWQYLPKSKRDLQVRHIERIQGHEKADVFIDTIWPAIPEESSECNRCERIDKVSYLHTLPTSRIKDRIKGLQSSLVVCPKCLERLVHKEEE